MAECFNLRAWASKNWFLLGLAAAVSLAWVFPEAGATGGALRSEVATKAGVAAIFLFQGLTLAGEALRQGARAWRLHALVQGFTFVAFPFLGLALDALLGRWLPEDLRLGVLFLCVLPSTISTSVVLTSVAGGNTAGAIFNATLSNVLGLVVTPLWVSWLMKRGGGGQALGPVFLEIVGLLLAPLVVGQLIRPFLRGWADKNKKRLGHLSSALILFIVYAAFCNSVQGGVWTRQGAGLTAATLGMVIGLFLGTTLAVRAGAKALGLNRADSIAALFCAPQKTLASGVPLAKIVFGAHPGLGLILLPILLYHPLQLIVCGMLAGKWAEEKPTAA